MLGSAFAQQQPCGETGATRSPRAVPNLIKWIKFSSEGLMGTGSCSTGLWLLSKSEVHLQDTNEQRIDCTPKQNVLC